MLNSFIMIDTQVIQLEWWSVTRDCVCYSAAVLLLIIIFRDERIYWYEAMVLVLVYVLYIGGKSSQFISQLASTN